MRDRDLYRAAKLLTGLTEDQFALEAGIGLATLQRFLAGKTVTQETKRKIDAALSQHGVSVKSGRVVDTITRRKEDGKDEKDGKDW